MTILVTVDEIEGDRASLLLRRGEEEEPLGVFPLADLPAGVKTGDILSLSFSLEEEETRAAKERIQRLHERLLKKNKE
ncbi:MAG TPA: DUF3006 domain-containing protein [Methanocorpusculum sp.]|nr:DUF3006 domain-containing protein [Methanocorpusculum sp.]